MKLVFVLYCDISGISNSISIIWLLMISTIFKLVLNKLCFSIFMINYVIKVTEFKPVCSVSKNYIIIQYNVVYRNIK